MTLSQAEQRAEEMVNAELLLASKDNFSTAAVCYQASIKSET